MRLASARIGRRRRGVVDPGGRSLLSPTSVAPSFSCVPSWPSGDTGQCHRHQCHQKQSQRTVLQSGGTLRILTGGSFRLLRIPAERSESNAFFTNCCSSDRARRRSRLRPARTPEGPAQDPFGVPVRHTGGPAHGGAGHHHRQRRPARTSKRASDSPGASSPGSSTATCSPSAACCCSGPAPATCSDGAAPSWPASPSSP